MSIREVFKKALREYLKLKEAKLSRVLRRGKSLARDPEILIQDPTEKEFKENIARVNNLNKVYLELEAQNISDEESRKDILRAAVVFMHSSLEEVIRNLYIWRLPIGDPEKLNEISIATEPPREDRKFQLGDLKAFEGKLVENLIHESVVRFTDRLSINNTTQLSTCLRNVGIKIQPLDEHYKNLDPMMKRRHQIVHQMDRTNSLDPLLSPVENITHAQVVEWQLSLESLVSEVIRQLKAMELRGI